MTFKVFEEGDVIVSSTIHHPYYTWSVKSGDTFLNRKSQVSGSFDTHEGHVDPGSVNLYEYNTDRDFGGHTTSEPKIIQGIRVKNGNFTSTINEVTDSFISSDYGSVDFYSLDLSGSISFDYNNASYLRALRNQIERNNVKNSLYDYGTISASDHTIISIPSIAYGSSLQRKTLKLKMFFEGELKGQLEDLYGDGVLWQTTGDNATSDDRAGIILYKEGFVILYGDWNVSTDTDYYDPDNPTTASNFRWLDFGQYSDNGVQITNSFYEMNYNGTVIVPTMTMFAKALQGECNYSTNPLFLEEAPEVVVSKNKLIETKKRIRNVNYSLSSNTLETFERVTFIDKVIVYNENKEPIAVATLAKPIRKKEADTITFKLQVDL